MKSRVLHLTFVFALLNLIASNFAVANTMDFNNLPTAPSGLISAGSSITQNGFTITNTVYDNSNYYSQFEGAAAGWQNGRGTDNGTTTVGMMTPDSSTAATFTLNSSTSSPFNFISIDIGGLEAHNVQFYNSDATVWTFVGTLAGGGQVSETINTNHNIFATYDLSSSFVDLTNVSITAALPVMGISISNGAGIGANFDNIVANAYITPVPVPAAIWLFVSALAGCVGLNRRKTS